MKQNSRFLIGSSIVLIVLTIAVQFGSAQVKVPSSTKWEYKVASPGEWISDSDAESTELLNRLGESGWEIVLTVPASNTRDLKMVLKRQK